MKKANFIFSAICAVLGFTIIGVTLGYKADFLAHYNAGGSPTGPELWPIVVSVVMLLCSGLLVAKSLKIRPEDDAKVVLWSEGSRRAYLSMLILFIYALILEPLGFIIATTLMEFVFIKWFSKKKWYWCLLISVVVAVVIYVVFRYVLNVSLRFGIFAP